eukprot:3351587-Ditylum_brightwellii.AAC.1
MRSTRDRQIVLEAMECLQTKDIICAAEYYEIQAIIENLTEIEMCDLTAVVVKYNPDAMYLYQVMKEPEAPHFADVVVIEINGYIEREHWKLILVEQVTKEIKMVDVI